jgi:hypothetical protein
MQKITQKNQLLRLVVTDQLAKTSQVLKRGAAWYGLAQRAVSRGFSQVQVGHKQDASVWPPQRMFG